MVLQLKDALGILIAALGRAEVGLGRERYDQRSDYGLTIRK
jgi:hypothetical protein